MYGCLDESQCFLALPDRLNQPDTAGVIVVTVPFEKTTSYGHGAAAGPDAILTASHQVEFFDTDLGFEPCEECHGIATQELLTIIEADDGESVATRLDQCVGHWLDQGKRVVTLGGEHTSIVGAIRAHAARFDNLTVLQLDAHSDLRETYLDDPWSHACAMARALESGCKLVQAGIRSEAKEERGRVEAEGIDVFRAWMIHEAEAEGRDWVAPILDACTDHVYLTLDLDVFDPAIIPATGTPEPNGLSWRQVNQLLSRLAASKKLVGFDLCELAPIPGLHHPQFTAAKLAYRIIGYQSGH